MKTIMVEGVPIGGDLPFILIAGPCVIEDLDSTLLMAERLLDISTSLGIPLIFKTSYDKANRSSVDSYRGPGLEEGLRIMSEIKRRFSMPLVTDVHCRNDIRDVADIVDVIQIPAFLSRQTDLLIEAARTGKVLNVKKGQFMAPWDTRNVIDKILSAGNDQILITERGVSFGYNNLVVDLRAFPIIRSFGYPLIFDVTHSLQLPGGKGRSSGGDRELIPFLARGAVGTGIDGLFMEVHTSPEKALCDGPNSMVLEGIYPLLKQLKEIDMVVKASAISGVN